MISTSRLPLLLPLLALPVAAQPQPPAGNEILARNGLNLGVPLTVSTSSSGIGGLAVAGSFILNENRSLPASLAPGSLGLPSVSLGPYAMLDSVDAVALYLENQSGDLATIWPATFDSHHVFIDPAANGGEGALRVGTAPRTSHLFHALPPEISESFVTGQTMVDTLTVPACRGRIVAWTGQAITVDRWVETGTNGSPCGPNGDPRALKQVAGVGIAYVGARNAIWLQNGNLYLDDVSTTRRAIADELSVYNRTGHYVEHGFDARFPGGLFPQADGPFVAGSLRISAGSDPASGRSGDGYQGTVAFDALGDWEYGFWSRNARRAHFLIAPDNPAHLGATGLLDTEPHGLALEVKPGNGLDTFSVDRATGSVRSEGAVIPGRVELARLPSCAAATVGGHIYVTDGRKPGETPGQGSGVPADCSSPTRDAPPAWLSAYDRTSVTR